MMALELDSVEVAKREKTLGAAREHRRREGRSSSRDPEGPDMLLMMEILHRLVYAYRYYTTIELLWFNI